jgi:hypothetical protein
VRRLDVGDPVADRLAGGFPQCFRPVLDRDDLRAEQVHPVDVRPLPVHVLGAHVDDALEPETGAHGRRGDAVLARPRLGDDPGLAEPSGEHGLAERVVQLVRAGVKEVLSLQVQALLRSEALRSGQRCRPAAEGAPQLVELGLEPRVGLRLVPGLLQLVEGRDQRLGDEAAAVGAVGQHRAAFTKARTLA